MGNCGSLRRSKLCTPLRGEQQAKHSGVAKNAKNNLKISEKAKVCIKKLR